ncbi:Protein LURP-one-related 6 [Forsythia ovata]|uniref:Protein LURP-one-related 6 n=1 Tax=Forsythia ovata TaxID=205694 RepID=A0ABD1P659_9LAMI
MAAKQSIIPIVSKAFCSFSEVVLVVRRRPRVVNGGGFVVTDCKQMAIFSVDGCGVLGKKEELILRDAHGNPLLLIRRKGGIVEALSMTRQWKGYGNDFLGSQKLVFSLKEPNTSCLSNKNPIRISIESKEYYNNYGNFEIRGDFHDRDCSIVNSRGDAIAQIGVEEEVEQVMTGRDLYYVSIKPGIDQAFVFGVIAVLDYIYDGSTRC